MLGRIPEPQSRLYQFQSVVLNIDRVHTGSFSYLILDGIGPNPVVGGANPGLVVLGSIRKQAGHFLTVLLPMAFSACFLIEPRTTLNMLK